MKFNVPPQKCKGISNVFHKKSNNVMLFVKSTFYKLNISNFFFVFLLTCYVSKAQCSYTGTPLTQVGSTYTFCVDNGTTYTSGTVNSGQYVVVNVVKGFTYTFSVGNVFTSNENLTILDASTNGNVSPATFASGASGATISNWVSSLSGQIKVLLSRGSCSNANVTGGAITLTLNAVGNTQDSQTAFGTDQWVAHVYNWTGSPAPGGTSPTTPSTTTAPFTNASYVGYYTIGSESISETFGGDYNCFPVYSNGVVRTNMYTEQYAIRYRMRSTKTGCYSLSTTGDDGVRVYVDGVKVYDEWKEQSPTSYSNILLYLNGNSDIIFDYYENGGQNVNSFSLTPFDGGSNTIAQSSVTVCSGVSPGALNGSSYTYNGSSTNPTISFQWQSSTDNVNFTNISGGTTEDYTPPTQTTTTTNVVRYYRRIVTAAAATASGCTYTSNVTTVITSPGVPTTPGTISGIATQCPSVTGQTYSIAAVTNTTSYNWTVPTGWTITSGAGTTSITVTTGTSGQNGNITVSAVNGCGSSTARTLAVTINSNNTVGAASSTPTLCINTVLTAITHATTGATGIGTPTNLPAGVTATWATNTITISGTPTASGTFNYSIPLTGGCGTVNASGTITVTPNKTASAASSAPTLCINTALTAINHTTTGATGIGTPTNLPAGVTAAWATNTITISGTPTTSGTFNYSIPLTGGCGSVNAIGTITVTAAMTASAASSAPTLCINTALTAINHTTTGATGIGTPTNLPAGVTAAWATNTITISGTPTASGTFTYSIPLTGGCGVANTSGTITVTPTMTVSAPSSAPSLCINTALTAITHATTGATGIGTPTNLPAGVTATWTTNTITISGTPTASGTFNYSIPLIGGCGTVNASGTITVTPNKTASVASSTPTLCINTALTAITHTTTGATGIGTATGLPTGVTAAWATNTITISGTPTASGTFNYNIPLTGGCGSAAAIGTIIVNSSSVAPTGITGTTTICNGSSTTLTVSGGTVGTGATVQWYTGSCGGTLAGTGNSITVSPTSNTTYFVRYSGTCNTTTCASQLVTVNTLSVAPTGITGTTTICNGSSATLTVSGGTVGTGATVQWYTGSCGGTAAGTGNSITVSPTSNTTYFVRYSGTCNTTTCASQLVTVNTLSVAPTGITGTTTICNGSSTTLTVSGGSAGIGATVQWYTGSCGGTLAGTGNSITVSPTSNTTYFVRYSGTCNTTTCVSQLVTVNTLSVAPTGITGTTTICNGSSTTLTVSGGSAGTGATVQWYTGSCGSILAGTGNSITVSPTSNTTYFVRYSGTCNTTTCVSQLVTVNTLSVAPTGITGTTTICNGSSTTLTVSGGTAGTGATVQWFTVSCGGTAAGTGNSITVSPTSNTTYFVRYSGTCNTTTCTSQLVTINARPTASVISGTAAICSGSPTNLQVAITGGTSPYSLVYSAGSINSYVSGTNIPVSPTSTTTYTLTSVTDANGCLGTGNSGSAVVTIDSTTSTDGGISWSNGSPSSTKSVIFDGSLATLDVDLSACSLRLTNNATVTVTSGFDVTLNGRLTVDSGSTFTLNNNANLLQNNTLTNSGTIVVKRNSSALKRLDYTLWSSPVTGQKVYAFSPFTFGNRFYVYRTNTNVFNNADVGFSLTGLDVNGLNGTDSNNVQFAQAKGYLIRMPWDHPTTATVWNGNFTGVPNNGDITYTMTNGGAGQRFNLVGNPYPSPISMTQFVSDNSSKITGTLYFWRETNNNTTNNAYCTWAGGTFTSNNEAQVFNPNNIIRTGQGFFVEASGAATSVDFKNGQRSTDNANQFFKTANTSNDVVETNRFWLNLTNATGAFCQMAAGYMTNATDGVDIYDGKNINTGNVLLNSVLDNTDYTIQGKSLPFNPADTFVLSYKVATAGSYTIAIDHVDGIFTNGVQAIYLKDNLIGTIQSLTAGSYTFASEPGTFTNRFEIIYQSQLSNPTFTANTVVVYSQNSEFIINSGNTTMATVKVFDVRGRLLQEKKNVNANQTTISGGMANEVLLVQIASEEGVTVTKKVIR